MLKLNTNSSLYPTSRLVFGLILLIISLFTLSSCGVQKDTHLFRDPNLEKVYRQGKKNKQSIIRLKETYSNPALYKYHVRPGDEMTIRFLNLPPELAEGAFGVEAKSIYKVSSEGYIYPPLIGKVFVQNKTTDEIQTKLVNEYSAYYPNPSLDISVANLRIYVYGEINKPGVVILPTEKTHIVEALSIAGGLPTSAKHGKVKIIRGDPKDPQVIWVDLRRITSLNSPDLYMQSGDIVVVEARNMTQLGRVLLPYRIVFTVSTAIPTFYLLLRNIGIL